MNDAELLRRYAQEGSQDAFTELVNMRLGMVYSAALRQTGGDVHRAREVAQAVFTDLARKAASLCRHQALIGWLYTSTRYAVTKIARADQRRRRREQEAFALTQDFAPCPMEIPADRLRPLLDEAMHHISEADRQALLLRFFDGRSLAEVGEALGMSESAAQKRVERALAKLRDNLARRGLSSTALAVAAALGPEALAASAPPGLAAAISAGALAAVSTAAAGLGLVSFLIAPIVLAGGLSAAVLALAFGIGSHQSHARRSGPTDAYSGRGVALNQIGPVQAPDRTKPESAGAESAESDAQPRPVSIPLTPRDIRPAEPLSSGPPGFRPPFADNASAARDLSVWPPGQGEVPPGLQVFDPVRLDQRPIPISPLRSKYPLEMRRRNVSGEVLVDFTVDASGRVRDAVVARSSRGEFERAALEAVSGWKFKPGRQGGRAVSTRMQVPIVFTLDSHD